jgi:PPOX class probable F420-dependent enzyme
MADDDLLLAALARTHQGVLATIRSDGRPQLTNVVHTFDPSTRTVRISTTADRAKSRNLRRDPRATYYVPGPDFGRFIVAETTAEMTPVAQHGEDAVVDELAEVYRDIAGEHPDWTTFRTEMVNEKRLVIRLYVAGVYGQF